MRNKRLSILVGAVLLALAAFWLLDFRLAFSNTENEKLVTSVDMGESLPVSMQAKDRISLVVTGEGPLAGALQQALTQELEAAGLGEVVLERESRAGYPNPVLIVKVTQALPVWTPVFAMSAVSVHAGYDSSGDTTFMPAVEESHTSIARPDAATMYAEYDVRDRSVGLISRPGYYRHLAEYLAVEIVTVLKGMYHV